MNSVTETKYTLPSEIVMEPEGYWSGRVTDSSTGRGIEGAEVCVSSRVLEKQSGTKTDCTGQFKIKRFTWLENNNFDIDISNFYRLFTIACGYEPEMYIGPFPEEIMMKPAEIIDIRGIVLNRNTNELLSGVKMCIIRDPDKFDRWEGEIVTDEYGSFSYSLKGEGRQDITISVPGYMNVKFKGLEAQKFVDEPWIVRLIPAVMVRLKIVIKDEIGQPVVGVPALVKYWEGDPSAGSVQNCCTDSHGEAVCELLAGSEASASVEIYRPGYRKFQSQPFSLDTAEMVKVFVLQSGVLFQNLRVVGEPGKRVIGQLILAKLTRKEGSSIELENYVNNEGFCTFYFPVFERARICFCGRPDTAVDVSFEDVLKQKEITLFVSQETPSDHVVQGVVQDNLGRPLKGISVNLSEVGSKYEYRKVTDNNGCFRFTVFKDRTYKMSFDFQKCGEYWYEAEDIENVKAGEHLAVTMEAFACVYVHFAKKGGIKGKYEAWLESDEGSLVQATKIKKSQYGIIFIGIPDGKMRAVVKTEEGDWSSTDFFKLKDGKSLDINMIFND